VSTRKVDDLVRALGLEGMSRSEVLRICAELDDAMERFRSRPLEAGHPYLWLDAKAIRVRQDGQVVLVSGGERHRRAPGRAAGGAGVWGLPPQRGGGPAFSGGAAGRSARRIAGGAAVLQPGVHGFPSRLGFRSTELSWWAHALGATS